jgi:two-component system KDP operon response regulator KdpE
MNILVVDDEPAIQAALKPILTSYGQTVVEAGDARQALERAREQDFDLVLLDLGLPDADGSEIIGKLREDGDAAIVILSARHLEQDKVRALDEGADDYVNKPFGLDELMARVRVIERRRADPRAAGAARLESDQLSIDTAKRQVLLQGEVVKLSPKEFALLEYFLHHVDEVLSRAELAEHVWDDSFDPMSNVIDVTVHRLRRKVDGDRDDSLLHTVKGAGYVLRSERRKSD